MGSQHPFTILTDHKNLQYLREAKRLNPRHARWALFFTRFNYTISYRPGPKNTKADALSRLHTPEETEEEPESIIPENSLSAPYNGTPTLTPPPMLPRPLRRAVHQGYSMSPELSALPASTRTCIPGHPTTPSRCWKIAIGGQTWPGMSEGSSKAVLTAPFRKALATYQQASSSRCPLPIPNQPWSHLWVDFITDLPDSDGNTCIMVIVDRFSKYCGLLPLRGLPKAMMTAEFVHLTNYVNILWC